MRFDRPQHTTIGQLILNELLAHPEGLAIADLARRLSKSHSTIRTKCYRLRNAGYVWVIENNFVILKCPLFFLFLSDDSTIPESCNLKQLLNTGIVSASKHVANCEDNNRR